MPSRVAVAAWKPARSISQAAEVLTRPSGSGHAGGRRRRPGARGARSSAANASASRIGLVKNEPALTRCRGRRGRGPCPCRGAAPARPRARRPSGAPRADLDAERARELGVADRAPSARERSQREAHREHDPAPGLALERARAVGEAALRGRERRDLAVARGRARARRRSSRRPPGRRRRRSGSASRRPSPGCRPGTRRRPGRRPTQRATSASHGSPAATSSARARRRARRRAWRSARRCPGSPRRRPRRSSRRRARAAARRPRRPRARRRRARPRSAASTSGAAGPPRRRVVSSLRRTAPQGRDPRAPRRRTQPDAPARAAAAAPPARRARVAACACVLALLGGGWLWLRDSRARGGRPGQRHRRRAAPRPRACARRSSGAARDMTTLHVRPDQLRRPSSRIPAVMGVDAQRRLPARPAHRRPRARRRRRAGRRRATACPSPPTAPCCAAAPTERPAGRRRRGARPPATRSATSARCAPSRCWRPPRPSCARKVSRVYAGPRGLTAPLARRARPLLRRRRPPARRSGPPPPRVLADRSSAGATYLDLRLPERPAAGGLEDPTPAQPSSRADRGRRSARSPRSPRPAASDPAGGTMT